MTDLFDQSSAVEEFQREASIRAVLNRSIEPLPACENCDESQVHVTDKGVRFRYCGPCTYEITGRTV